MIVAYRRKTENDSCHFWERLWIVTNETLRLLEDIHNYIRECDALNIRSHHFPDPMHSPVDLSSYSPKLICESKKGAYLFFVFQPLKYIFILLSGRCCVEKYKSGGQIFTDSAHSPLAVFGLAESYANTDYHTVSMRCITDCVYAKIPVPLFQELLFAHPQLMRLFMEHLSVFYLECTSGTDQLILNTPARSILIKLRQYCQNQTLPVTIRVTKEELAQDLNMNLRTLYRHLDKLYGSGMLSSRKGKITISQKQLAMIEEELSRPSDRRST